MTNHLTANTSFPVDRTACPETAAIIDAILAVWPEHMRYLQVNFSERDQGLLAFSEKVSAIIRQLSGHHTGGLAALAEDYRYLCQNIVLPEELHFRRHGTYRLKTFEDALRTVYANSAFMHRYMCGLLVSDVIWINHCKCMQHYRQRFLPSLPQGATLLEIGPGHGLLLKLATEVEQFSAITAWDIAEASLKLAAHTLDVTKASKPVTFVEKNIFDPSIMQSENASRFDAIVLSEVLEHLERPGDAVAVLHHICKPGGQVWINVPANSPAPDHLYLVRRASDAAALMEAAGFDVIDMQEFPTSGTTLERAIKQQLTFNCVLTGRKKSA